MLEHQQSRLPRLRAITVQALTQLYHSWVRPSKSNAGKHRPILQIVSFDLSGSIDLSTFQSSSPAAYNCTSAYPLSGRYGSTDYLAKQYTGLPVNHYYLIVRFSMAYMGTWANTDMFAVTVDNFQKVWNYSCNTNQAICTTSDCIRPYEVSLNHSATTANFNVTATMAGTPPTQSWGIREIIVAVRTCHPYCLTCYGPNSSQCYSCQPNYFLSGTACVNACPHFTVRSVAVCLETCPDSYYSNEMDCEMCHESCATCRGPNSTNCITSFDSSAGRKFSDNLELWIFLIVLAVVLSGGTIWYFFARRKRLQEQEMREQEVRQKMLISELNVTANELPESRVFEFKKKSDSGLVVKKRKETEPVLQ